MAALAEHFPAMHPYEQPYDYPFLSASDSYPALLGQDQTFLENHFHALAEQQNVSLTGQFSTAGAPSSDLFPATADARAEPASEIDAYQAVLSAKGEGFRTAGYLPSQGQSPRPLPSQPVEAPPSTLSLASGGSVASAPSSTFGSPASAPSHILKSDPWPSAGHGLGIHPGIVQPDSFTQGTVFLDGMGQEIMPADDKRLGFFVGKSAELHSPVDKAPSTSLSSSPISQSPITSFSRPSPFSSYGTPASGLSIDAILQGDGQSSPAAGPPLTTPSATLGTASFPSAESHFKSPVSPALARTSGWLRYPGERRSSHPRPPSRQSRRSSSPITRPASSAAGLSSKLAEQASGFYGSPFFSQSSGNFVAPLASCWFPFSAFFSGASVLISFVSFLARPRHASML